MNTKNSCHGRSFLLVLIPITDKFEMKQFLKKHWGNMLIVIAVGLLIVPQTSIPIKVFVQRLIMSSPSELEASEIMTLSSLDWSLRNLNGEVVSLTDSKNKVIVLNLWATWCPPCIAELPNFQNLYNEFGDRIDFYFVSAEEAATIQKFLQKKKYNLPIYLETKRPPKDLQVSTIPTTFVIDKDGKIVVQKTGVARWDSEDVKILLRRLLND
jgi:thiol-disulfide isomerase/thioredoxin